MAIATPIEFRAANRDPAGWCSAQIDEYLDDCLAQLPAPTPAPEPVPALPAAA